MSYSSDLGLQLKSAICWHKAKEKAKWYHNNYECQGIGENRNISILLINSANFQNKVNEINITR